MPPTPALHLGPIPLASPLMLSPMAGYTILPFRVLLRRLGGLSVAATDFINARSLIELNPKAMKMIASCPEDRPLGVQLFGAKAWEIRDAARFLEDVGIDYIDINMGCPVDKVTKSGAGAALLKDEELSEELVCEVIQAVRLPVTVKMRLGWDESSINAHILAPRLERLGVAAVAVHGRTAVQGYEGVVNLEGIRAVVQSVKKIPVIGNGDVNSPQDAARMLREIGCSAVMVGRAALRDPFFFRRTAAYLNTGVEPEPETVEERLALMHEHFRLSVDLLGEEDACQQFRKVIMGYSEFFPAKEKWRVALQTLQDVEEYLEAVDRLCPAGMPEAIRRPHIPVRRY